MADTTVCDVVLVDRTRHRMLDVKLINWLILTSLYLGQIYRGVKIT